MKRPFALLLAALILAALTSCTGGSSPAPTAAPQNTEPPRGTQTATEATSAHEPDHSCVPETDFDKRIGMNGNYSSLFETEDAYYWLPDHDDYIRWCEKDGSDGGVLCARPECEHDRGNGYHENPDCGGWLNSAKPFCWYMDGKIYYIRGDLFRSYPDSCAVVFRMEPDGTNKELFKVLPKPVTPYGDSLAAQTFCYHRGVIYSFMLGSYVADGEPSLPFVAAAFPLDGDGCSIIYDAGVGVHYGSVCPSGEYCYIVDQAGIFDPSANNKILRWSSVTGELELLYEGSGPALFRYWIDEKGDFYTEDAPAEDNGNKRLLRLADGEWEQVLDFEDPDTDYYIRSESDGIVIALNEDRENNGKDKDIDIWIKRYDGTTVYKGRLPMAWFGAMDDGWTFVEADLFCGNENELLCIFETERRTPDGWDMPKSLTLVRYAITEDGLAETVLGTTYHEIENSYPYTP